MAKVLRVLAVAVVIALASLDAGPNNLERRRLGQWVGSDPPPPIPDCNGIRLGGMNCPMVNGHSCGKTYDGPISADPGGVNDKRYDKSPSRACTVYSNCPNTFDYTLTTMGCTPKKVEEQ